MATTYALVTDDSFTRADTIAMYGPNSIAIGNGWIDPIGLTKLSLVSNQVVAAGSGGGLTTAHAIRRHREWTRDCAVVADQPGYTQSGTSYTGFGAALAFTGENVADRDGYYATWQTSGSTGILQIFRCNAGSSTVIAFSSPTTGPSTTNGLTIFATKITTTAGQNTISVSLYTGSGGTNPYSGNANAPGTPYFPTLTFTDTSPGLFNQGAGGHGFTLSGGTVGQYVTRVRTYTAANTLLATPATPLYINSTVTINLTNPSGSGTSWSTSPPTFTAVHKTSANGHTSGNFAITRQAITDNNAASITVNTGNFVGSVTITDPSISGSTYVLYVSKPYERWCVIGDSISYQPYGAGLSGSGAPNIQSPFWVAKTLTNNQAYGKSVIVNATGVVGSTTTTWLSGGTAFTANMPAIVVENPDRIYIFLGANDSTGSTSQATYLANMTTIINYLLTNTTSLIHIIGPIPRFDSGAASAMAFINQYNDASTGIVTLPAATNPARVFHDNPSSQAIFAQFAGRPEIYSGAGNVDGLHPGDVGMLLLGQNIAASIMAVTNPAPTGSGSSSSSPTRLVRRF